MRRHVVVLARRPRTGPRSGWELGEGMHVDVPVGIGAGGDDGVFDPSAVKCRVTRLDEILRRSERDFLD